MTYPLMLCNKQTNKQPKTKNLWRLPAKKKKVKKQKQKSSLPIIIIVLEEKGYPTDFAVLAVLLRKMHWNGGQQRALSDQQSVSLVHFHLLLISQ